MGIHAVSIYFTLCLWSCIMVFMNIVINMKRGVFKICNISKGDKQKNCARFFKICKYTFLMC